MQCLSSSLLLCQRCSASKSSRSPSMATTITLSPLHTALCPRRCVVTFFLPRLSSYSPPKPSSVASFSISSRPRSTRPTGPRARTIASAAIKPLSDSELLAVPTSAQDLAGKFPSDSGVYAVFGCDGDIQFIGISRNLAASVLFHRKSVPELCCSVKIGLVDDPDRTTLTQAWKSWMEEQIRTTGKVPPGNETGNTTWIRQPPVKKADLRLTPGQHVQLTLPLEDIIDRLVKETRVVAFIKGSRSAPLCGFSQKVVGILTSEGVDFESVDVLDEEYNHGLREALKKYSKWPTFPQIFVNGELVGGCDILTSMQEKGELAGLFKK